MVYLGHQNLRVRAVRRQASGADRSRGISVFAITLAIGRDLLLQQQQQRQTLHRFHTENKKVAWKYCTALQ